MTEVPLTTQEHLVREEKRAFNTHGDGINGATSRLRLMVEPANLDCLREALSHYSGGTAQVTTRALTITSFDTDDRRFRRRGIAMDFECDGRRCAQTLRAKRSDGGENVLRTEWEADTSTPQPRLDMITDLELRERVGFLRDDALVSLFMTRIERQEQVVTCQENNLSNLVLATLDVGEINVGDVIVPFAEICLENIKGASGSHYRLALELNAKVPMTVRVANPSARARAIEASSAPPWKKARPLALTPEMSAETAMAGIFASCVDHWTSNETAAMDGRDPEGVHQLRVGMRRFRSALTMFGPLLPDGQLEWLKRDAKWAIQELNAARDWDVFIDELLPPVMGTPAQPSFGTLRHAAEGERQRGYEQVCNLLRSQRYTEFMLRLGLWLNEQGWREEQTDETNARLGASVVEFAGKLLAKRHKAALKRGKGFDDLASEQRHEVRIALKKIRYASEFFHTLFPGDHADAYLTRLKSLQDDLGHLNDVAVAEHLLLSLIERAPHGQRSELAWAAGQVQGWYMHAVHALEPVARRDWDAFRRSKKFWSPAAEDL